MTKILLVEDDKSIVANLTQFLTSEGYEVKSTSGQVGALKLIDEEMFDLALLDVSLADGNGFSLCSAIKKGHNIVTL